MNTKKMILSLLVGLSVGASAQAEQTPSQSTIYTYSTIDALLTGAYDGNLTIGELKNQGNFGLGTYNRLDGEMVLLNGKPYHVHADGKIEIDSNSAKTPLAYVTDFSDANSIHFDFLNNLTELSQIEKAIDSKLPNPNYFYAIKIEGKFRTVVTRAIAAQNKPYRPMAELVKTQSVFTAKDVEGTLIGFKSPGFSKGVSVPGYHWHFISKDEKFGGHVLKADLKEGDSKIQTLTKMKLDMPDTEGFAGSDQTKDRSQELHSVETIRK